METTSTEQQDDASRFWREEKETGAVYNAFLKKVTYLSQTRLEDENEKNSEFSHLMWETHKVRVIKAGTLEKLVESLTNTRGEMDSSHVNIFLATYRTFATPQQVLETLIERYVQLRSQTKEEKTEFHEQQLRSLKSVIFVWLDSYPEDFHVGPEYTCLHRLEQFAHDYAPGSGIGRKVKEVLAGFRQQDVELAAKQLEYSFSLSEGNGHPVDTDSSKSLALLEISCRKIAEQLTCRDAGLFLRVIPHHCLGAVWSRRDKQGTATDAPSIQATIQQFNNVSLRVIATLLKTRELKSSQRAKVLQKWITIAQDLRELKNFSSLKAIITGLQSHAVYRLRKTWSALSKDSMVLFEELSEIFSVENNQLNSRELLMKEATAKFPDLDSQSKSLKRKNLQKRRSWIDNGIVQGTVPYLGTFLTDLTMIDSACPDTTEEGLINFEKRRKEFEVIAQIKLLQVAASIYNISEDERFWRWFNSIRTYSDTESHELSCSLEPPSESSAKIKKKSASLNGPPFRRRVSAAKLYACFACKSRFSEPNISRSPKSPAAPPYEPPPAECLGNKPSKIDNSKLGLFSCGSEDRNSIASIPDTIAASIGPLLSHSSSTSSVISSDSDTPSTHTPFKSSDSYVIKVSMETGQNDTTHVYKSIMLMNSDHTQVVIEKILEKYGVDGRPDQFCLLQLLPDGELLIPERANVFYALNNSVDLKFILRSRRDYDQGKDKRKTGRRSGKKSSV
ncbi:ral guanine nucleotide dissociation stimulator-like 1 isoform X1 [Aplysia californica]|uniref:Ral guanine nucleotide dissociation stimulator-like 1 isoform X1 n=1 Tax=Aplysia californica TaxID=6500 RepID=A0ABM1AA95_APLCA|nr:ral guanine nucleotide dissociation stimulator-like 1 isoform X1 [Aplysia californica]